MLEPDWYPNQDEYLEKLGQRISRQDNDDDDDDVIEAGDGCMSFVESFSEPIEGDGCIPGLDEGGGCTCM